jgi:phosphoribosylamine--glycine ligase
VKVLVIGGGGREHALVWKLSQSDAVEEIVACPGHPGIASLAKCMPVDLDDVKATAQLAVEIGAELVVVGPEGPLAKGLADRLKTLGVPAFGPPAAAARIESSKAFAKEFMARHKIPTAQFAIIDSAEEAIAGAERWGLPVVVKADGLAAKLVIENCLVGEETSVLTLVGPGGHITLPASQDYKRIYENDRGPNTGGMGALCPLDFADSEILEDVEQRIIVPTLKGLESEGIPFTGVLYSGLMLTDDGPFVIEFNCRMGDPESQAVLPAIEGDLATVMARLVAGETVEPDALRWSERYTLCTVMASRGYPATSEQGIPIAGIEKAEKDTGAVVFHAGTRIGEGGRTETAGGRVLGVTGFGDTLTEARANSLDAVSLIDFDGAYYRKDIGARWLETADRGEGA